MYYIRWSGSVVYLLLSKGSVNKKKSYHYTDVIMGAMGSQITRLTIVYSTVYLGADQRKHQTCWSFCSGLSVLNVYLITVKCLMISSCWEALPRWNNTHKYMTNTPNIYYNRPIGAKYLKNKLLYTVTLICDEHKFHFIIIPINFISADCWLGHRNWRIRYNIYP